LLGQQLTIPEWIPDAFRDLLQIYTPSLELSEYEELGINNIWILDRTRARIHHHRLSVAFRPPPVIHDPTKCTLSARDCEDIWNSAWWGGFAPLYLHPDAPSTPQGALEDLGNACIPMMGEECQTLSVKSVANKGILEKEEKIISHAIEELGG
jgi:hypothetical protein